MYIHTKLLQMTKESLNGQRPSTLYMRLLSGFASVQNIKVLSSSPNKKFGLSCSFLKDFLQA